MLRIIVLLLIFVFSFKNLFAADIPIIVIAPSKKVQSISTVGSSVSVFDEKYIENTNDFFLGDVLGNGTPSYNFFQSGGYGTESGIQLRGLPKRYSTVYIDGVKMSDPSSVSNDYNFNHILKNQLSRVEILRGNQSSVYGSGAVGGSVILTSKSGEPGLQKDIFYNTASNSTHNLGFSFSGADENNNNNFYIGGERLQTEGISAMDDNDENDKYRNNTLVANFGHKFSNVLKFKTNFRLADTYLQYDTVDNSYNDKNYSDAIESSSSIGLIYNPTKKFTNKFSLGKTYIKRIYNEYNEVQDEFGGDRNVFAYNGTYNFNLDNSIVFGIDNEFDEMYRNKGATSSHGTQHHSETISRYVDFQTRINKNLYATLGVRFDDHSKVGNEDSERVTLAYLFDNKKTKLKSSFGTGFRFPSLYEMYFQSGADANLVKAETSESFDIGFEKKLTNIDMIIDLSYFNLKYNDVIESWLGNNWEPRNSAGTVTSKGIELISKWKASESLNFDLNYTYTSTYDGADWDDPDVGPSSVGDFTNKQMVRVPRHFLNFETKILFLNNNFDITLITKWSDTMRDYGNANVPADSSYRDVRLDDFLVNDLSVNYPMYNSYKFYFDIINIFDERYNTALQYSQMDRSFNLGIKRVY